ncbi:MAG: carboxypeptidase-like regulatory domain-containing protein [Acidimicrobiia bacterium]
MKRSLSALLAGGLTVVALGGTAAALPNNGGGGEPGDPPGTNIEYPQDLTVKGSVSVSGCAGSAVNVTVSGTSRWNGGEGGSATVNGSGQYQISGLERGAYKVTASIPSCPYGVWNPGAVNVPGATGVANKTVTAPTMSYAGPQNVTRIPASLAALALQGTLNRVSLHLDNHGPEHGLSHQLDNASTAAFDSSSVTFTVPEYQIDLDCGILCPDLGQGKFYVNDVNLASMSVEWANNAFQVNAGFESSGREVKGYFTNSTIDQITDDLMPDMQIDDAHLKFSLRPVADGKGGVTYARSGNASFDGSIQATGACDVGVDVCDAIFGYKDDIRGALNDPLNGVLDMQVAKDAASAALRPVLNQLGIGNVVRVISEANDIVVTWTTPTRTVPTGPLPTFVVSR